MVNEPLTPADLTYLLGPPLAPALSTRRTTSDLVQQLSAFPRHQQELVVRWVGIIANTNAELAFQFASHAPRALATLDLAEIEGWVLHGMDVYDGQGLYPACSVFADAAGYAAQAARMAHGITFEEISGVLSLVVRGLTGRELLLEAGDDSYTDTRSLFLPPRLMQFSDRDSNFRFYKSIVAHLWAQTWYGTFRINLTDACRAFADPAQALRLFHALETIRLDARITADLPGLGQDMRDLQAQQGAPSYPEHWTSCITRLQRPAASVEDTHDCLRQLYGDEPPAPRCYQGQLFPDRTEKVIQARIVDERRGLHQRLAQLSAQQHADGPQRTTAGNEVLRDQRFQLTLRPDPHRPNSTFFELTRSGVSLPLPKDIQALLASILQDLGEIPAAYLVAGGDSNYLKEACPDSADEQDVTVPGGALHYHEWDFRRQHYRKDWCSLSEIDVHPGDEPFVLHTRQKYAGLLKSLRKTFEVLRGEDRKQKNQTDGDDIDFDALINARADMHHGMEMPQQLFIRPHKVERDIAVMFMVDMSGSTKGWINLAEREALVLLCEALEVLGDRYAIYGFSGLSRKRCELFRIKRFNEPYNDQVRARIAGIKPQDYTRMGVIIRHLTHLLNEQEARTKLLITLSDGKPDDFDGYRGEYGIEDTRQALIEARRDGIHPFCITIDTEARDYLPHMYGAVNYIVLDDVRKLPLKVADIYRRLTV